ncbi:CHC2 zinc finger domain-containing protein [Alicyclobacillus acidoterrestris]|uniref:CHC2 zinc finger domain-containing protein n=1 Tax=Alicyclobacillus acidoterrestris TaxID=1450 RepID=UPI0021D42588|nr:CHC2 zinc finger domain-containing protein [Alicyclobacillus acidoterrestris]
MTIVDLAEQASLKLTRMRKHGQYKTDCPFCGDMRQNLELNAMKNVFHCWVCDAGGGLVKFYALLHDVSEDTARNTLFPLKAGQRRFTHPALNLTQAELDEIGFELGLIHKRPASWSPQKWGQYRKRTLDWVWFEWKRYNAWKKQFNRRIGRLLEQAEHTSSEGEQHVETERTGAR